MKQDLFSAYKILPEQKLIIEYHEGSMSYEQILLLNQRQIEDPAYNSEFNIITDFRNVQINANIYDLEKYIDFLKDKNALVGCRKNALLTEKPNQVAQLLIFNELQTELKQKTKIFSTVEGVIKWLPSILSENDFCYHIKSMKNKLELYPK